MNVPLVWIGAVLSLVLAAWAGWRAWRDRPVVLRQLYDQPAAPSRLAEASGLTRGAISKLVDRLLEKGLLTRVAAAGDRRYQEVQLTAAGRALVPELAALADANDAACFEALTAEERATLAALLRKLAAARQLHTPPTD